MKNNQNRAGIVGEPILANFRRFPNSFLISRISSVEETRSHVGFSLLIERTNIFLTQTEGNSPTKFENTLLAYQFQLSRNVSPDIPKWSPPLARRQFSWRKQTIHFARIFTGGSVAPTPLRPAIVKNVCRIAPRSRIIHACVRVCMRLYVYKINTRESVVKNEHDFFGCSTHFVLEAASRFSRAVVKSIGQLACQASCSIHAARNVIVLLANPTISTAGIEHSFARSIRWLAFDSPQQIIVKGDARSHPKQRFCARSISLAVEAYKSANYVTLSDREFSTFFPH